METQKCSKCGKPKDVEEFNWRNRQRGIRQNQCKVCTRKDIRSHYRQNMNVYKERAKRARKKQTLAIDRFLRAYLTTHACVDCGEDDPVVLHFDHVRQKNARISRLARNHCSIPTIVKEIENCEVRCANCHMRRTARQFNWKKLLW